MKNVLLCIINTANTSDGDKLWEYINVKKASNNKNYRIGPTHPPSKKWRHCTHIANAVNGKPIIAKFQP